MSTPSLLFDRALLHKRLRRAQRGGAVLFLIETAAQELAERLSAVLREFHAAADVATPTDSLRRALGERLPAVAAVDFDEHEFLPLARQSLDLAVSARALQFVNDLPGALTQIRLALKPDGLLLAALVGGDTLTELRQSFAQAESELEGGVSPHVAPFVDLRDMGTLMQRAGFALPVVDVERLIVRYDDAFALMRDLRAMGATNILRERRRVPLRRATLARMVQIYGERFSDSDGRIRATFDIVWLSGWAPDGSQQQPLRPGSAKSRLADALGVREQPAGDKPGGE
jgi:SAM-dependent methyltransferase